MLSFTCNICEHRTTKLVSDGLVVTETSGGASGFDSARGSGTRLALGGGTELGAQAFVMGESRSKLAGEREEAAT